MTKKNDTRPILNNRWLILIAIILVAITAWSLRPSQQEPEAYWPTEEWRTKTPQETGMNTELLYKMMKYVKQDEVYSIIIVKDGYIVLEYYDSSYGKSSMFNIYSCTKSITSSLIGILIDQGTVASVEQPLSDFFPEIMEMGDPEKEKILVFLTNNLKLGATTVAAIYRDRWQIEIFFKALKQNLKIKTFVGTTANAVKTQIWTALIAMLVVKYLKLRSTFGWSLSNLIALLRMNLFTYRDLWSWLDTPFEIPIVEPSVVQLELRLK